MSKTKSNAEILPWINIGAMCSCVMEMDNPCAIHKQIASALTTAQSSLAKDPDCHKAAGLLIKRQALDA